MVNAETVLVTGASGFIGRSVVNALAARRRRVLAITRGEAGPRLAGVEWLRADLRKADEINALMTEACPSYLVHAAWAPMRPGGLWEAEENWDWVDVSRAILTTFWRAGGKYALVCGSCAEYAPSTAPCTEFETPIRPESLYGRAKAALHESAVEDAAQFGGALGWARIFFAYGLHEQAGRLVSSIIDKLLVGEPAPCSEGRQIRDYIFSKDVGAALAALTDAQAEGPFNVASGAGVEIREIAQLIGALLERPSLVKVGALASRPYETPVILADISRIKATANWSPAVNLKQGLEQTIKWRRNKLKRG